MDYLQTLEFQLAALQRKIRLFQDLRYFVEAASPEELAAFGDELRSVITSSGQSVGALLSGLLGADPPLLGSHNAMAARDRGSGPLVEAAGPPAPAALLNAAAQTATPRALPPQTVPGPAAPSAAAPSAAAPVQTASSAVAPMPAAPAPNPAAAELRTEALAALEDAMRPIGRQSFVMGSETGGEDEKPPHKVHLSAFRVCDHLATNREYALFVRAQPSWSKDRADPELRDENYLSDWNGDDFPEGRDEHPVAFVSFFAAEAYAVWLGKRLLREAEWECAARGGLVGKKYPSGDQMNDSLANLAKQYRGTTPVRKFSANGYGLYDMAGNLFEWTSDWYGAYAAAEVSDPVGPAQGEYKVVRGGSWMSGAGGLRVSARVDMDPASCGQVGIRLAD